MGLFFLVCVCMYVYVGIHMYQCGDLLMVQDVIAVHLSFCNKVAT